MVQCIFFFPCLSPHQNIHIALLISSQSALGNRKHDMTYVGINCAIAFVNASIPALKNVYSFHPLSFCTTLSCINEKVLFLIPPIIVRIPKYLSCFSTVFTSNLPWSIFWEFDRTLQLVESLNFSKIIFWLVITLLDCKILLRVSTLTVLARLNSRLSSEKKGWDMDGAHQQIIMKKKFSIVFRLTNHHEKEIHT